MLVATHNYHVIRASGMPLVDRIMLCWTSTRMTWTGHDSCSDQARIMMLIMPVSFLCEMFHRILELDMMEVVELQVLISKTECSEFRKIDPSGNWISLNLASCGYSEYNSEDHFCQITDYVTKRFFPSSFIMSSWHVDHAAPAGILTSFFFLFFFLQIGMNFKCATDAFVCVQLTTLTALVGYVLCNNEYRIKAFYNVNLKNIHY